MKIPDETLPHLCEAIISNNQVRLKTAELPRELYVKLDKILRALGGSWNTKAKAHIFDHDPTDSIEAVVLTGRVTTPGEFGYFPTPDALAKELVDLADIERGMLVLEPSAGRGAIVKQILAAARLVRVRAFELLPENSKHLDRIASDWPDLEPGALEVTCADFLTIKPEPIYDRIVMNPPFAKRADIKHIEHASQFLKPNGRLVSVLSSGVQFRSDNLTLSFRAGLKACGAKLVDLPEGSFKSSGTNVSACVVVIPGRPPGSDAIALSRIRDAEADKKRRFARSEN